MDFSYDCFCQAQFKRKSLSQFDQFWANFGPFGRFFKALGTNLLIACLSPPFSHVFFELYFGPDEVAITFKVPKPRLYVLKDPPYLASVTSTLVETLGWVVASSA